MNRETLDKYFLYVIEEIAAEERLTENGKPIPYEIHNWHNPRIPNLEDQVKILKKLHEEKALKINYIRLGKNQHGYDMADISLTILHPKFDEILKEYELRVLNVVQKNDSPTPVSQPDNGFKVSVHTHRDDSDKKKKRNKLSLQLTLTRDGNLYKDSNDQVCYAMRKDSDRLRLISILAESVDYVSTKQLALKIRPQGTKKASIISKEIAAINLAVLKKLGLDKLIEGRASSGYKLNYKIQLLDH